MAIKTGADAKDKVSSAKTKDEGKTPPVKKERGPSYQEVIVTSMKTNKGVMSRDALMKATGADARNLSVAVSILKNGKRTKVKQDIRYIRKTQTFYALPMASKAFKAAEKVIADAKAPAKKVAKSAEK